MKQRLKKILIIVLILVLFIGMFNCIPKFVVKNIFDEMYFGTKDIWGGRLTSTSWNNMSGLAKTIDSVKYAVPDTIHIGFSNRVLSDDEQFQVIWETDKKRILFTYSVSILSANAAVSAVLNVYYSPCKKILEVYPLKVASSENIYGDTSPETIDSFFRIYGASEEKFYARATEVFKTVLINNWRAGNPATLFKDTLGEFEIMYKEVEK